MSNPKKELKRYRTNNDRWATTHLRRHLHSMQAHVLEQCCFTIFVTLLCFLLAASVRSPREPLMSLFMFLTCCSCACHRHTHISAHVRSHTEYTAAQKHDDVQSWKATSAPAAASPSHRFIGGGRKARSLQCRRSPTKTNLPSTTTLERSRSRNK